MTCTGCGNDHAYATFTAWPKNGDGSQTKIEWCDKCKGGSVGGPPDVYWDGKPEHGLADDPVTGQPRVFSSKREKAAYLKERGLVEAGDRVNGARPSSISQKQEEGRGNSAAEALHRVRQMSPDYRRNEVLRILKESGR